MTTAETIKHLEDIVERALVLLDQLTGDPDAEDDDPAEDNGDGYPDEPTAYPA